MPILWSQDQYTRAWRFAAEAHHQQKFPGTGMPYIVHVANVAMEVMTAIARKPVARPDLAVQCALLHDVVEDTPIAIAEIENTFGKDVACGVAALSKNDGLPTKSERMSDSLKRILEQPKEIWMVKLADRITNLQKPPHYWKEPKIAAYHREAIVIYEHLKEAHPFLSERLHRKIDAYQQYFTKKT